MKNTKPLPPIKEMRQALTEDLDALEHRIPTIDDPISKGLTSTLIEKLREELPMLSRKQQLLEVRERVQTLINLADIWQKGPSKAVIDGRFGQVTDQNGEDHSFSIDLGGFATEREAALAYDRAAILMYGDDADTNFPPQESEHVTFPPEIMRQIGAAKRGQRLH